MRVLISEAHTYKKHQKKKKGGRAVSKVYRKRQSIGGDFD